MKNERKMQADVPVKDILLFEFFEAEEPAPSVFEGMPKPNLPSTYTQIRK